MGISENSARITILWERLTWIMRGRQERIPRIKCGITLIRINLIAATEKWRCMCITNCNRLMPFNYVISVYFENTDTLWGQNVSSRLVDILAEHLLNFLRPSVCRSFLSSICLLIHPSFFNTWDDSKTSEGIIFTYHHHLHHWLCCPLLGPGCFFSFVILYTVGRTPCMGISTSKGSYLDTGQHKQNKHTQTSMPRVGLHRNLLCFILMWYSVTIRLLNIYYQFIYI
jgi:hypothetical protein